MQRHAPGAIRSSEGTAMLDRYRYQLRAPIHEAGLHLPPGEYVGHIEPEIPPRWPARVRLYVPGEPERSVVALGRSVARLRPVDE